MGALLWSFFKRKIYDGAMSHVNRNITALGIVFALLAGMSGEKTSAQADPNSAPNPYRTVENWAKLPEGRTWGHVMRADIDRDGKSIWVVERCGGTSCAKSDLAPVLKFDSSGNLVKSFGAGMIVRPHGLFIDMHNNVWVTDGDAENGKGDQVFEFTQDGKFIKSWGKEGTGPGEFNNPHSLAMDSKGRLFVADRGNNRVQIFDQDGTFIAEWKQFGRPSGIFIDKKDVLYSTD